MKKFSEVFFYPASPVGDLTLIAESGCLIAVEFGRFIPVDGEESKTQVLLQAASELREYFAGKRTCFTVPLKPEGTPFRQKVWQALRKIPYGEVCSYQDIASAIGTPKAVRAVGGANGANPLPIFIPCHRVIGKDGSLTGYSGGMEKKIALLSIEGISLTEKGKICSVC